MDKVGQITGCFWSLLRYSREKITKEADLDGRRN